MTSPIPTHPPSEWCNTDDAAAYLGYTRKALEAWRYSGTGPPFYRVGNRASIKYAYADLKAWMEAQRVEPQTRNPPNDPDLAQGSEEGFGPARPSGAADRV